MKLFSRKIVPAPPERASVQEITDLREQFRECLARLDEAAFTGIYENAVRSRRLLGSDLAPGYLVGMSLQALDELRSCLNRLTLEDAIIPLLFLYLWQSEGTERIVEASGPQEEGKP